MSSDFTPWGKLDQEQVINAPLILLNTPFQSVYTVQHRDADRRITMEEAPLNCFPETLLSNSNVSMNSTQTLALVQPNTRTEQAVGILP